MLIVLPASGRVVPYLTDGRHPGRWSEAATRLLGLEGPVAPRDLRSVLEGCDPATGTYLPRRRPHRRRVGWDLVFGAPKSVSLLGAAGGPEFSRSAAEAHAEAVSGVLRYIEARLVLQRFGPDGRPRPAEGLVAAAFDHRANAAEEPHLHTHLVVANLSRSEGQWGPVRSDEWYIGRGALAALYQMELRHRLYQRGWALDWRLRPDGLADLADVPRAAVRAASTQSRTAVSAGRYQARRSASLQPWQERVAEVAGDAGRPGAPPQRPGPAAAVPWRPPRRLPVPAPPHGGAALDDPVLERKVTIRLAGRRSDFRTADVIMALAACHAGGAAAEDVAVWADRFCGRSHPVASPTSGPRWTTEVARRADREIRQLVEGRRGEPLPAGVVEGKAAGRGGEDDVVRALTASSAGAHFLGAPAGRTDLLAQAEALLSCREVWEGAGRRVAVSSPTPEAERRWQVLAGLAPYRPGDRVDILVVDQADRRTSADLARLVRGCGAALVFVEGGTLPRLTNPASHGLAELGDELGRLVCRPCRRWEPSDALAHPPGDGVAVGRAAAGELLARWRAAAAAPLLVGLGLEEVRELNRAARAMLSAAGPPGAGPGGPGTAGDRSGRRGDPPGFAPGDRVVVLGRRPGLPGYGVFGTVTDAPDAPDTPDTAGRARAEGRHRREVGITWEDGTRTRTGDPRTLAAVGLGYAVTPAVAARTAGPVMVLGPASSLGRGRDRVVAETALRFEGPGLERSDGLRVGR